MLKSNISSIAAVMTKTKLLTKHPAELRWLHGGNLIPALLPPSGALAVASVCGTDALLSCHIHYSVTPHDSATKQVIH